jgi:hypothetical protein
MTVAARRSEIGITMGLQATNYIFEHILGLLWPHYNKIGPVRSYIPMSLEYRIQNRFKLDQKNFDDSSLDSGLVPLRGKKSH